jgi:hypothetical protein
MLYTLLLKIGQYFKFSFSDMWRPKEIKSSSERDNERFSFLFL